MIKPQFEVDRWNYKCPIDRNKVSQGSDNYQIKSLWFTSTFTIRKKVNCLPDFLYLLQKVNSKSQETPPFLIDSVFLFSSNSPPHRVLPPCPSKTGHLTNHRYSQMTASEIKFNVWWKIGLKSFIIGKKELPNYSSPPQNWDHRAGISFRSQSLQTLAANTNNMARSTPMKSDKIAAR